MTGLMRPPQIGDCLLCGERGAVQKLTLRLRQPVEGKVYVTWPRCVDRIACRGRVEASGEEWPVDDRTPAPVTPKSAAEPVPVAQPMEIPAAVPADAAEENWFA